MDFEKMVPERIRTTDTIPPAGTMYGEYIHLAIPSIIELVLTSLIGMFDTMMVSGLGTDAVAAVGLTTQPKFLVLCFFFAMNTGITAVVARRKGEGRLEDMNRAVRNAMLMIIVLAAVLMSLMLAFMRPVLLFAGAEEGRTLQDAVDYLSILMWCVPIQALTMGLCAAQRGAGKTKITMYVNIVSNLVNILFNWLLINGKGPFPRLGIKGAAIATDIGQCVGFLLVLFVYLSGGRKGELLHFSVHDDWRPDKRSMMDVLHIMGGSMVEQIFIRFGFFTFAKIAASLGTDFFAAHQIGLQFLTLSFSFADGCAVAGTALVGQKLGEGRKDLSYIYGKLAQRTALVFSFLIALVCILLRRPLVGLYISENASPGVQELAERLMFMVAVIQPFQMVSAVASGSLRGAGDVGYTAKVMAICVAFVRTAIAYAAIFVLKKVLQLDMLALYGVWLGSVTDMVIRCLMFTGRFRSTKWCDIKV